MPGFLDWLIIILILAAVIKTLPFIVMSLVLAGCDVRDPGWKSYQEVYTRASDAGNTNAATTAPASAPKAAPAVFRWTKPASWTEQPGSGMRLATFMVAREDQTATCTIITLGGAAGQLAPNVRRWFGQLNLPVPPEPEFSAFRDQQQKLTSEGGLDGVMVDLTGKGSDAEGTSFLAALFTAGQTTVFVKLSGPVDFVKSEKENFTALCLSLRTGG